jgi:hypothetical protein
MLTVDVPESSIISFRSQAFLIQQTQKEPAQTNSKKISAGVVHDVPKDLQKAVTAPR